MTVGGGYVYWCDVASGIVDRVSVNGGAVTQISTVGALGMTTDSNNMYWISTAGDVYQVAHGSATPLKIGTAQYTSTVIVSDGTYVYLNQNGINGSYVRIPVGGGDAGDLTPNTLIYTTGIAFAGGVTYLAVANTSAGAGLGLIGYLPGDGGLPVTLVSGLTGLQQLTTDGTRLYWVEDNGLTPDGIYSSSFDGGSVFPFTQTETHPKIITDGTWLYYTNTTSVQKRPADGSGVATKIFMTRSPWTIAQDANDLYWCDRDENVIYRGPKH